MHARFFKGVQGPLAFQKALAKLLQTKRFRSELYIEEKCLSLLGTGCGVVTGEVIVVVMGVLE